jgi:small subunit ribosomal protein S2
MAVKDGQKAGLIEALFTVGAHFGYSRARRHASMKSFVFGSKGRTDILDLEKTSALMEETLAAVKAFGANSKQLLFVGGKPEIRDLVREAAGALGMPHVAGRWLGGTLSNFTEIKKRIKRLIELVDERERGELARKYTKRERVLIDREIARLEERFSGLVSLERIPDVLVAVDTRAESIAVREAHQVGIPVVGIMSSDCDLAPVKHPLVGNDASRASVTFFLDKVVEAYREGQKGAVANQADV